jgi:prostaglandin reductase 1
MSKNSSYPVGAKLLLNVGWVMRGKINPDKVNQLGPGFEDNVRLAPELPSNLSPSLLLGACGRPGNSAYFGLTDLCQPKAGETLLVNGAAGSG